MSNIFNKINQPVEIKRIDIRVWKLRDEIEAAISQRIEESGGDENIDIQDIKDYYTREKPKYLDPNSTDNVAPIGTDGVDSSGNEMDDDAKEMMDALQQGQEENSDSEADNGDDDEAAKAAAQMLGDQLNSSSENSVKADRQRIAPQKEKISTGFSLLSDMNMEKISFFSNQSFTQGQNIALELLIPKNFILSGEVTSCLNISRKSSIISESKPNYRIEMEVTYLWEGERTNLRDFLKSIEPSIITANNGNKNENENDKDKNDQVDDLGL